VCPDDYTMDDLKSIWNSHRESPKRGSVVVRVVSNRGLELGDSEQSCFAGQADSLRILAEIGLIVMNAAAMPKRENIRLGRKPWILMKFWKDSPKVKKWIVLGRWEFWIMRYWRWNECRVLMSGWTDVQSAAGCFMNWCRVPGMADGRCFFCQLFEVLKAGTEGCNGCWNFLMIFEVN